MLEAHGSKFIKDAKLHVYMLSARQRNFLPTFGFTNRVSYNEVSTFVVWNQWKNQENVQPGRFQLIGQSDSYYLKCGVENILAVFERY